MDVATSQVTILVMIQHKMYLDIDTTRAVAHMGFRYKHEHVLIRHDIKHCPPFDIQRSDNNVLLPRGDRERNCLRMRIESLQIKVSYYSDYSRSFLPIQ